MWALSGGLLAACARRLRRAMRSDMVPMMGVLGAFVFAAQMINFSIPGTGSSGHLGGGLLLAVLLGPRAAFLVIASVLTIQALFFADGGLLALGCNLFNLGALPAFVAYPLVYRPLVRGTVGTPRAWAAAVAAAVVGLELGALAVVVQTRASGISSLPFGAFATLMLPIHLAIGLVEGFATAAVVAFVARTRPATLAAAPAPGACSLRRVLVGLLAAAVTLGGVASWFASTHPDGLEWSIAGVTGSEELETPASATHGALAAFQERTAVLPDYGFAAAGERENEAAAEEDSAPWPTVDAGTSVSGLVGGALTLGLALLAGLALRTCRPAVSTAGTEA